jgi:hypothetical protein
LIALDLVLESLLLLTDQGSDVLEVCHLLLPEIVHRFGWKELSDVALLSPAARPGGSAHRPALVEEGNWCQLGLRTLWSASDFMGIKASSSKPDSTAFFLKLVRKNDISSSMKSVFARSLGDSDVTSSS